MTPPPREYWRVWSDGMRDYDQGCPDCELIDEHRAAEDAAAQAAWCNNRSWRGHADWRPVKVRETVVEE